MAQSPEKFTYQAVVRNANNVLVADMHVRARVCIKKGSDSGEDVYSETHVVHTNANGLLSFNIGDGTVLFGDFSTIQWSNGPFFLEVAVDPHGGNDYTIVNTQQLLSVPYALYAQKAGNGFSGSYNDLADLPVIPEVPTNVSAFTNNASGFSARPSGYYTGPYNGFGSAAFFWTTTDEPQTAEAWYFSLFYGLPTVGHDSNNKATAFSVRCLRN